MTEGNFTLVTDKGKKKKMSSYANSNVVAMDIAQPDHMVSFGKRRGCHLSRGTAWFLAILFVSCLVATGLLVYYYAPHFKVVEINEPKAAPLVTDKPYLAPTTASKAMATPSSEATHPSTTTATASTTTTTTTTANPEPPPPPPSLTTTIEAAVAIEKIDVRLPRSLKPLQYIVKLQPFINGNFSIHGYVEIEMEVLQPTSNITLHINGIITHNDTIKLMTSGDMESQPLQIQEHKYDPERYFYVAHLEQPLEQGKRYSLSMHFQGYLNDQLKGFYRSSYRDDQGTERRLAVTQFQPTSARQAFPCFDEPELKATFEISLAREENMSSISNMPIAETMPIPDQDGWFWDHYNTSVPMSTYLVAFVVSDFAHMNATGENDTFFRVWSRESAIDQAEYALEIGPSILSYFEDYYQVPYPLPKQDMIALPDFRAGAMENWGLVTYRENYMLIDPVASSISNKVTVAFTVAHELAHQWFGNIVTPKWWDELWLNEGFASYMQYLGAHHVDPSWKVMEQFVLTVMQSAFTLDSLESSHPISIPVQHPDEISQIFDTISYRKGASIIRMMSHFLTETSLRKGLANYLEAFKYNSTVQDDLWDHLTMAAHEDGTLPEEITVKTIMDTWTLQMGYPVIKVSRSTDGTSATITQQRFLLNKSSNSTDDHSYSWWVPLNYASKPYPDFNQTNAQVWMKDTESEITLSSLPSSEEWVIFNLQETGYYRVNYDDNNWRLLIQQLETDHEVIHTINRAQIIDDAMDLAGAGHLSYEIALGTYGYLGNETDYVPWKSAVNNLGYIIKMFKQTGGYGALKSYVKDIIIPLYDSVGFEDDRSDPLLQEQLKRKVAVYWACKVKHQDCIDNAKALFREWMQHPYNNSIIFPNTKYTVLCRAIEAGDEEEWNFAWNMYLESNVASDKYQYLTALGCSSKVWILSRYLNLAFKEDGGIRKQDADLVFASVAANEIGRPLAWTYLRDNWDTIFNYFGKANRNVVLSAMKGFNTRHQLRKAEQFQQDHVKDLDAVSRALTNTLETIKNNIAWMDRYYDVIVGWLEGKGYSAKLKSF